MVVTVSSLYNLVECPKRVMLEAFGDPADQDEVNPFVRVLWERGTLCREGPSRSWPDDAKTSAEAGDQAPLSRTRRRAQWKSRSRRLVRGP